MNNNDALIKYCDDKIEKYNEIRKSQFPTLSAHPYSHEIRELEEMKTYLLSLQSHLQDKDPAIPIDEVLSILNENYQTAKRGKENAYTVKEYLGKDALDLLIETYEDLIAIFNKKCNQFSQSVEPLYKEDEKKEDNEITYKVLVRQCNTIRDGKGNVIIPERDLLEWFGKGLHLHKYTQWDTI